jgi:hypothetical protein
VPYIPAPSQPVFTFSSSTGGKIWEGPEALTLTLEYVPWAHLLLPQGLP